MVTSKDFQTTVLVSPLPGRSSPFRSIVLKPAHNNVSDNYQNHSLIFDSTGNGKATCRFQPTSSLDLTKYSMLNPRPIYGCLGLLEIQNDIFLGVVTEATRVSVLNGNPIYRINNVAFYSLINPSFDNISQQSNSVFDDDSSSANSANNQMPGGGVYHPCSSVAKLLCSGSFYISPHYDFTRTYQKFTLDVQMGDTNTDLFERADESMFWNRHMLKSLLDIRNRELSPEEREILDQSGIMIPCIQGYVGQVPIQVGGQPLNLTLISRLSCLRAGTRLLSRGVDDDGNVSNHVETEMIITTKDGKQSSFVQMRGSVPLFWEQTGIQMTHKITIARGLESSLPSFGKHMGTILDRYKQICIINLLSQKPQSNEQQLSELFERALHNSPNIEERTQYVNYDFHSIVKRDGYDQVQGIVRYVREYLDSANYSLVNSNGEPVMFQDGIVRTNCLDCLDRTNVIQTHVAKYIIYKQFTDLGVKFTSPYEEEEFFDAFNGIWADNGDWLSKIYAGTGALKSSVTRKGKSTFFGFIDDAVKSTARFYINNFSDKGRQDAIDFMLGKSNNSVSLLLRNPLHEAVQKALFAKINEFSSTEDMSLFVGTWNVNGKMDMSSNVSTWIRPMAKLSSPPQIYSLGIQELIELNAGSYITSDSTKIQEEWEKHLLNAINKYANAEYVTLRSSNLVALGLFLFVRKDCVSKVRNVSISIKRTGLGGITANKGGIGISFNYNDSPIALITAHFAAGQQAVAERNNDFMSISSELNFHGRHIYEHELIVWFGDFNYRINGDTYAVRNLIEKGAIPELIKHDQLKQQQKINATFVGYNEGEIEFNPTYKYDNGTNNYDTSEKMRVPAWTDRVLYKGALSQLLEYSRAECLSSDHRPVRALFKVRTRIIDKSKQEEIRTDLYQEFEFMKTAPVLPTRDKKDILTSSMPSLTSPASNINYPPSLPNRPELGVLKGGNIPPNKPPRSINSASPNYSIPSRATKPVVDLLSDDNDSYVSTPSNIQSLPITKTNDLNSNLIPQTPALIPQNTGGTLSSTSSNSVSGLQSKFDKLNIKYGYPLNPATSNMNSNISSSPITNNQSATKNIDPNDPFGDIGIVPSSNPTKSNVQKPAINGTTLNGNNYTIGNNGFGASFSTMTSPLPPQSLDSAYSNNSSINYQAPSINSAVSNTSFINSFDNINSNINTANIPMFGGTQDPWKVQPLSGNSSLSNQSNLTNFNIAAGSTFNSSSTASVASAPQTKQANSAPPLNADSVHNPFI